MKQVVIVDSGVANLASIKSAFEAIGAPVTVTAEPAVVATASRVVLPGVGSFGAGLRELRANGLDRAVCDAIERGKPLLAICLGMQMLAEASDESPGVKGLGVIPGRFVALPQNVRVPHLGWNYVTAECNSGLLTSGYAAFANSYCLTTPPKGWIPAWTTHGTRFVSALIRGSTLGCQFHPELSGKWGLELLSRWLHGGIETAATEVYPASEEAGKKVTKAEVAGAKHATRNAYAPYPAKLTRRIIPCLDVRDGRVVKGVKFQHIRDAGDPAIQAALYEEQGADEIVLLDIAATPDAKETQLETVRAVRAQLHIPLTVGGGVRDVEDARRLLSAGADKVSVNTAAVNDPSIIDRMAGEFGTQCVVLAIDARQNGSGWEVLVSGGRETTGVDATAWAREGVSRGAGEILLTSWDRDGTREGCDAPLLQSVSGAVPVPVIASGGIGTREHVADALEAGSDAVLAASVFHDGDDTVKGIKQHLRDVGQAVRL
jgi:imidazole glycerol phosphate synthase glutamine amidotransferase subunit